MSRNRRENEAMPPTLPVLGGNTPGSAWYEAYHPSFSQDDGATADKESRASKERDLDKLAREHAEKSDCSGEEGCTLITLIIEFGDPAEGLVKGKVGHAGMGIGDAYYDFGPTAPEQITSPGTQWWDNPST